MENLYALDLSYELTSWFDFPLNSDTKWRQTSQVFAWASESGINQQVDWTPGGTPLYEKAWYYDWHSGPIQFYADTVLFHDKPNFAGLQNPNFNLKKIGWARSMFFNEPIFIEQPKSITKITGETATFTVFSEVRGFPSQSPDGFTLQWQKKNGSAWTNIGSSGFGKTPLTLANVTTAMSDTLYRAVATFGKQVEYSDEVKLSVKPSTEGVALGIPAAPSNLKIVFTSASQINLTWDVNSSNETNISVYRGTGASGPWTEIVKPAGTKAYSDTGLIGATKYYYLVKAWNASGPSAAASVNATTLTSVVGTNYTLEVKAFSSTTGQNLSAGIYSWQGVASDYRQQATSFTRLVPKGTSVSVQVSSTSYPGGVFQYWQGSWGEKIYGDFVTINLGQSETITAVYNTGTSTPTIRTLSNLAVEGPSHVDENDSAQYKAKATYSDGSSAYVTPTDWDEDSAYAHISDDGVLDAKSVDSDKEVEVKAVFTSGGVTKTVTKSITIENTDSAATYTLTLNDDGHGYINASPDHNSYAAGTEVRLYANADNGYNFSHWSGNASGSSDATTLTMNSNKSVTANFSVDTSEGQLTVNILPAQAAAEGAQWQAFNYTNWYNSGNKINNIPPKTGYVSFKEIPGWITPDEAKISIVGGKTLQVSGTYQQILGSVAVTINPPEAATAGARWKIDSGAWLESGTSLGNVNPGTHTITFLPAANWSTPAAQNVVVTRGNVTVQTGFYEPPIGLPIISSIFPSTGPLEGGTDVTIEGANFQTDTIVKFGTTAATNVSVQSATKIIARTPAKPYGTVDVAIVSSGQTATKLGGFTYDIPLGNNMTLLSQIGGTAQAIAVSGTTVLYGEGSSLVAADFKTPNSPIVRGRLPLPGLVKDIEIVGNYALVANASWGLQIVDIQDLTAMKRVGFCDTPGYSYALGVSGNLAFLADSDSVQVIDFTNRASPVQINSYRTDALDVGVSTIAGRKIVCVSAAYNGVLVLDATDPSKIQLVKALDAGAWNRRLSLSGAKLLSTGLVSISSGTIQSDARVYDISSPENPKILVDANQPNPSNNVVLIDANRIYGASNYLIVFDLATGSRFGNTALEFSGSSEAMAISGSTLYVAAGEGGILAISVDLPSSPKISSKVNQSFSAGEITAVGNTAYVALSGAIVDVTNPTKPTRLNALPWTVGMDSLLVNNSYLFGTGQSGGLSAFSLGSPTAPVLSSTRLSKNYIYSAALLGQNVVLGSQTADYKPLLLVVDGTNVQNQTPISSLQISSETGTIWDGLTTSGNTVFAIIQGRELRIYDYTNPAPPQFLGSTSFAGTPSGMVVSADGKYLFVSNYTTGLSIYDCRDRKLPRLLTTYARNNVISGYSVAISGSLIFYGDQKTLNVLDCTDPANPRLVAAYDTPGLPYDLFVRDSDVFVADDTAGVDLLRLGDIRSPIVDITAPTASGSFNINSALISLSGTASDDKAVSRITWSNNRGGGGVLGGGTSWSIPAIQLSSGRNIISVRAEDANGNVGSDSITVNATFADTSTPVIEVTSPSLSDQFICKSPSVTFLGAAADDTGLASVTWANNRGGSGTASGTTAWNSGAISLLEGPNQITISASDLTGNVTSKILIVAYVPGDTQNPSIAIEFPTLNSAYATSSRLINLSGSDSDNQEVAFIVWSNDRGGSGSISPASVWSVNDVELQKGLNIITVTATDLAGNASSDSLAVYYTPRNPTFAEWQASHFTLAQLGIAGVSGWNADPDNDKISNGLERYFNFDPLSGMSASESDALPKANIQGTAGQQYLTFRYRRLIDWSDAPAKITISDDLKTWDRTETQIEPVGNPIANSDGLTETVTVRLKTPMNTLSPTRKFLRLELPAP